MTKKMILVEMTWKEWMFLKKAKAGKTWRTWMLQKAAEQKAETEA